MTTEQNNSIILAHDLGQDYFVWQMSEADKTMHEDQRLEAFLEEQTFDEDTEKVFAIMEHTGDNWDEAESDFGSDTYKVLTDDEADELLDERLEEYIDDCVLCNIYEEYHRYFNRDEWKSDNTDDRGHWLNYSDGSEEEETINGTTYYIYKQ
jgi:hypothetical protein